MSWTERCQGKGFDIDIYIELKAFSNCKLAFLLFIRYNDVTLFFAQGGRGYSGEKVSVFLSFSKLLIIR